MIRIFQILVIIICLFDQTPSLSVEAFEKGEVFTPWSRLPVIRLSTVETVMLILLLGSLPKIIQQATSSEFRRSRIVRAHFLFLVTFIIGSIVGAIRFGPVTTVFFQGVGMLHAILVFFLTASIVRRDEDVKLIIQTIIVCASAKSLQGLYFWIFDIGRPGPEGTPIVFYDLSSCNLMILILLFTAYSWSALKRPYKFALMVGILPAILSFIFSYRRNLYLGVVIALALTLMYRMKGLFIILRKQGLRIFAVVLAVGAITFVVIPEESIDFVWERFTSSFGVLNPDTQQADASNAFRIFEAINVLDNYVQNPILGAGFGGRYTITFFPEGMDEAFVEDVSNVVHISYLGILYKTGIVGLIALLSAYGLLYLALSNRDRSEYGILHITFFVLVVILVSNCFSPNVFFERVMSLPALLFGLSQTVVSNSAHREREIPGTGEPLPLNESHSDVSI